MCIYIHIHTVTWYHGSTGTYANSIPLGNPITFVGRIPFYIIFLGFLLNLYTPDVSIIVYIYIMILYFVGFLSNLFTPDVSITVYIQNIIM